VEAVKIQFWAKPQEYTTSTAEKQGTKNLNDVQTVMSWNLVKNRLELDQNYYAPKL